MDTNVQNKTTLNISKMQVEYFSHEIFVEEKLFGELLHHLPIHIKQ